MSKALKTLPLLLLMVASFVACEKDFSSLGTEIIGGTNFTTTSEKYPVTAFNKRVDPVRSDGLPVNYLGIYNDPLYGNTSANFISQMGSPTLNPTFGENVALDSVVLTIPYFSTVDGNDEDGNVAYKLDSIFGSSLMKLTGFRNNYFLRDFDPDSGFEDAQQYYSNGATSQTGMINTAELEGDMLFEIPIFGPTNDPIIIFGTPDVETGDRETLRRDPPALRLLLDNDYWKETIIDKQGEPELSNQANFEDYFRGVYFKVEPIAGLGTMMLLDFANAGANITLHYTKDGISEDTNGDPLREQATYAMTFSGNRVNLLDNTYNFPLVDGDAVNGDEKLFLKGGEGSTAIVNLFNGDDNGESADFTTFKNAFVETDTDGNFVKSKRLVNEANLVFYVDQTLVNGEEPSRVYLYNLNGNVPLIDYFIDPTINNGNAVVSRTIHLGALQRVDDEPDGEGIRYRVKITEHINNLLLRDSTNVKLGLAISGNINLENSTGQFDIITDDLNVLDKLPVSSIVSPRGTVLFGSNTTDEDKKVQLEIFYTEPNN